MQIILKIATLCAKKCTIKQERTNIYGVGGGACNEDSKDAHLIS